MSKTDMSNLAKDEEDRGIHIPAYEQTRGPLRKYKFGFGRKAYSEAKKFEKFWKSANAYLSQGRWNDWNVYI